MRSKAKRETPKTNPDRLPAPCKSNLYHCDICDVDIESDNFCKAKYQHMLLHSIIEKMNANVEKLYEISGDKRVEEPEELGELEKQVKRWSEDPIKTVAGFEIAPEDLTYDGRCRFTWYEAMGLTEDLPDGWHIPTCKEWMEICLSYVNDGGEYDRDNLVNELRLTQAVEGLRGSGGFYWSASTYQESNSLARHLIFNNVGVDPRDYCLIEHKFSVRLVRRVNK